MDPNAALMNIAYELSVSSPSGRRVFVSQEIDDTVDDLREWIAGGGFEPDWERHPLATSYYKARVATLEHSKTRRTA